MKKIEKWLEQHSPQLYGTIHAREFALAAHRDVNHLYDGYLPYEFHLRLAVNVGLRFIELVPLIARQAVIDAIWNHDVIEDARKSYNDVKQVIGFQAAEMVYAVTNEKGRTRKDRANDAYYEGIRKCPFAAFVKLSDRIANVSYGKLMGGRMVEMYRKEQSEFEEKLGMSASSPEWPMVEHLRELLKD